MAMDGDLKVPGLGDVPKKYVIGGVVVGVLLGVVVYIRSKSAAQAAASTAATTAATSSTDTSGDSGYYDSGAIDPSTGIPYAEEDSGDNFGGAGYGYGSYNTDVDAAGYPIGSEQDLMWQQEQNSGITTNDEWVQEAIGGAVPGDPGTIQAALSGVLGGLTVTTAQKNLFLEAVGVLGQPPQGYPTPIKTSDTAGQPGTGTTPPPSGQVTVPNVVGMEISQAGPLVKADGLGYSGPSPVKGKIVRITSQAPAAGTSVSKGTVVRVLGKAS